MSTRAITLSDADLSDLFSRAQAGDRAAMEQALMALEPLLRVLCRPLRVRASNTMEPEDLLQEARLNAILAIRRYDQTKQVPPGAFVALCVKRALRFRITQAERQDAGALSLDAPVGQDDRTLAATVDPGLIYHQEEPDLEMDELLRRVPQYTAAGATYLGRLLQSHGLNDKLPDDATLAELVKAGKTKAELAYMFGVTHRAVTNRLATIRKAGVHVPPAKREGRPPAKLLAVVEYLTQNPAATVEQAVNALGVGRTSVFKARRWMRERAG